MQPQSTTPREIPLTKGYVAIVDAADYDRVNQFKWMAGCTGRYVYAMRRGPRTPKQKTIMLHRFILDAPAGLVVDHINHDTLDNRRENLRLCTYAQNGQNRKASVTNKSGYKGVYWNKDDRNWRATIKAGGFIRQVGTFSTAEDAARAYDAKARELFGEFARTNF